MISNAEASYLMKALERILAREDGPDDSNGAVDHLRYNIHPQQLAAQGRIDEAITESRGIIKKFEALPLSQEHCRILMALYNNLGFIGILTWMYNKDYDYPVYFEKADYYFRQYPLELSGPVTVSSISSYVCRVGYPAAPEDFEAVFRTFARAAPHVVNSMNGCYYGLGDLGRCEVCYFRDDLNQAEKFAYQAIYKARERKQYEIENRALFFLLRINLHEGNVEAIDEVFRQLEAQLEYTEFFNRYTLYDIITGWFYAHTGETEKISPWLKNDFEEGELNSTMHGLESLVKVKCHFTEKRYHTALASLDSQTNKYGLGGFLLGKIEMKVLEAVCRYHIREKEAAFKALEEAYEMAAPNALDMPFIEMGRDMRTLSTALLNDTGNTIPRIWLERIRRRSAAYAKKVLVGAARHQHSTGQVRDVKAALSRRELDVLTGLSQGLTREEIAEAGSVSINTVKSAITGIYQKLGAVNRADAVRIAAELGILKVTGI
jgi:LuxR family maltose regulon positive regulatory protein